MPTLVLTFEGKVIRDYAFLKTGVTIGRRNDNAIVIDNLAVSGYHAKMERMGTDYVVTDLDSTNGTFVNDKKITSCRLFDGDNVTIGKHTVRFVYPKSEAEAEAQEAQTEKGSTMVLETAKHKERLARQDPAE